MPQAPGNTGLTVGGDAVIYGPAAGRDVVNVVLPPPAPALHVALPSQAYFFGREEELRRIAAALSPQANGWGVLIEGAGGIGKTWLAVRAGHLAPEEHFPTKLLLTAKAVEMTAHGEVQIPDIALPTYAAFVGEIAAAVGGSDVARLEPGQRTKAALRALSSVKALLVLDNVESLDKTDRDRLFFEFLRYLPRCCRALVTSRFPVHVGAELVRLERLLPAAAMLLLTEKARTNPLLARASAEELKQLYETATGNPLLMEWIAGQVGRHGSRCRTVAEACAYLERAPEGNNPLEYLFADVADSLDAREAACLAALSHFVTPVSPDLLAGVAGVSRSAAGTLLSDLLERGLVEGDLETQRFILAPIVGLFLRKRSPDRVEHAAERLWRGALAVAAGSSGQEASNPQLDEHWPLLEAAIRLAGQAPYDALQRFCKAIVGYLYVSGRWDERLALTLECERRAVGAGDHRAAGWRAYQSAYIYCNRGQAEPALDLARRAEKHWSVSAPEERAFALRLQSTLHTTAGDLPRAVALIEEALALCRPRPDVNLVGALLHWAGLLEHSQADETRVATAFQEALDVARQLKDTLAEARVEGRQARAALRRGDWATAARLASKVLDSAKPDRELAATCQYVLARSLAQQGRHAEARELVATALHTLRGLRVQDLPEAERLLQECERHTGPKGGANAGPG